MADTGNAAGTRGAALAVAWVISMGAAQGQPAPAAPEDGADLSATVTVVRALVSDEGAVLRELPTSRYRVAHFPDGRLEMTMLATGPGPRVGPMADPYAGIVADTDLAGGRLRLRGADGRPLSMPGGNAPAWAPPAGPSAFLAQAADAPARRRALEQQFGPPAGQLRGLTRYVARHGRREDEVLVSAETQLPAELNVVEDGALAEHQQFSYLEVPGRGWVRHQVTAQTRVPGAASQRLLSVTTLTDIRTSGGAR